MNSQSKNSVPDALKKVHLFPLSSSDEGRALFKKEKVPENIPAENEKGLKLFSTSNLMLEDQI